MATFRVTFKLEPDEEEEEYEEYEDEIDDRFPYPYLQNDLIIQGDNLYPTSEDLSADSNQDLINRFDIIVTRQKTFACDTSTIYQASLNQTIDVILKFAIGDENCDRLLRQAGLYQNELKEFQGVAIPKLYGILKGVVFAGEGSGEDWKEFVCLVLQDCGEPADELFSTAMPLPKRHGILEMLALFHEQDLHPEPFFESHVVQGTDGSWRMVGFHDLDDHECEFEEWHFGEKYRYTERYGCSILEEIGAEFGVWDYWYRDPAVIGGINYPPMEYPSQKIIDALEEEGMTSAVNRLEWLKRIKLHCNEMKLGDGDESVILAYARKIRPVFDVLPELSDSE